jgi:hypothetical protein
MEKALDLVVWAPGVVVVATAVARQLSACPKGCISLSGPITGRLTTWFALSVAFFFVDFGLLSICSPPPLALESTDAGTE